MGGTFGNPFSGPFGTLLQQSTNNDFQVQISPTGKVIAFKIYLDVASEWRWVAKASNGEPLFHSSEGYKNRQDCLSCAREAGFTGN